MMSSVERIQYFTDEIPREEDENDLAKIQEVPDSWPQKGSIVAQNISMRYDIFLFCTD